jgi:hypothetical protein
MHISACANIHLKEITYIVKPRFIVFTWGPEKEWWIWEMRDMGAIV